MSCFRGNGHQSNSTVRKKVVPVADKGVGVGSLLDRIKFNDFKDNITPAVRDDVTANIEVKGQMVILGFFNSTQYSSSEFDRLRPVVYDQTNVFLLCFDIGCRSSLDNIIRKWFKEIEPFREHANVIVVGMKKDLREDPSIESCRLVTPEEGEALAVMVRAFNYVECSSKTSEGVLNLLNVIAGAALSIDQNNAIQKSKSCIIL